MLGSSAGLSKPSLSRSNHAGPDTAAMTANSTASAAATGSRPRFHRDDVVGHHQVDDDVGEGHRLGALELGPAAGVITRIRPALTRSSSTTMAFVAFDSALSRLGCSILTSDIEP